MLHSITWEQYLLTVALILICYYLFVGFKFYRWELLSLIGVKKVEDDKIVIPAASNLNNVATLENPEDYLPKPALSFDISPLVQSFTDEVKAYLKEAADDKLQKEALLNSLQFIASKYPALKDADCKHELIEFVLFEANKYYPDLLQHKDTKLLWK